MLRPKKKIHDKTLLNRCDFGGNLSVRQHCYVVYVTCIALSLELDQLVITRGAELHNEGSTAPSAEQGNPALTLTLTLSPFPILHFSAGLTLYEFVIIAVSLLETNRAVH